MVNEYKDYALTGRNDKRPALKRLIADCSNKCFEAVLVYSIDRFGRNMKQSIDNASKFEENGILLLSYTENFSQDPSGRFFRNMMMAYAQFYSDELSAKIKRGINYNADHYLNAVGMLHLVTR